jgi:hypothetical protein
MIEDSVNRGYENTLLSWFSQPSMREWWDNQPKHGGVEFEDHIDSLVAKATSSAK